MLMKVKGRAHRTSRTGSLRWSRSGGCLSFLIAVSAALSLDTAAEEVINFFIYLMLKHQSQNASKRGNKRLPGNFKAS